MTFVPDCSAYVLVQLIIISTLSNKFEFILPFHILVLRYSTNTSIVHLPLITYTNYITLSTLLYMMYFAIRRSSFLMLLSCKNSQSFIQFNYLMNTHVVVLLLLYTSIVIQVAFIHLLCHIAITP